MSEQLPARPQAEIATQRCGLVIATGMAIGTCFTLFVVPVVYTFLAKRHKPLVETA